ncbi:MAG: arylsulfatase [Armatimonadetes bacterium]|nr:arylsulfatase [Armatimonadota bacterium]
MSKPNFIVFLTDDQGYGDLGCFNPNCRAPTPVLDQLAADGLRFTDSHTSSAVCTPTRYSILTGRYNWRSRLKSGVLTGESPLLVETDRPTVASFLRDQGYRTCCVGKWHLGLGWQVREGEPFDLEQFDWKGDCLGRIDYTQPVTAGPREVGFEESLIIPSSLDIPPYVYLEDGRCTGIPSEESLLGVDTPYLMRRGMAVPGMRAEDVLPTFTARAVAAIEQHAAARREQPFFLYFPLSAPHTPIVPTAEYRGRTPLGLYGDFITQIDAIVGELLACLDRCGLRDDTLVVYTSDNGASPAVRLDELRAIGHEANGPWRGHKADLYEGGHRTPLIARWPGVIPAGGACDQTVCTTDLFATMADILEVPPPPEAEDSRSLLPLLRGGRQPVRESTVHHSVSGHFAIRQGRWKLLEAHGSGGWSYPTEAQASAWGLPPVQLYDLEADPRETTNVAAGFPKVVEQLHTLLAACRQQASGAAAP